MSYLPTNTIIRKDCEALHREYTSKGKGAYGEVYQACIAGSNDCGYVLKVITYNHDLFRDSGRSLKTYIDSWVNEVKVLKKLNKHQAKIQLTFSPKLYDAWYCREGTKVHFYILIEKYDGDLSHLLREIKDDEIRKTLLLMILRRMDSYLTTSS